MRTDSLSYTTLIRRAFAKHACILSALLPAVLVAQNADSTSNQPRDPQMGPEIVIHDGSDGAERVQSDRNLVAGVKQRLELDTWVPSYRIGIGAEDGRVTLSGTVSNLLVKQRAGELAKTVTGVNEVVNNIDVAVPSRQDWEIRTDVLIAFRTNEVLKSNEWEAPVRDGFVTLSGSVDSQHKKELAERVAKGVAGVRGVENQLTVSYPTTRSDRDILADVVSRLNWNPWLQTPQLVVRVAQGVVNLSGFVQSEQARRQAIRDAWVTGTTGVDARDLRITESIQAAFLPPGAPEFIGEEPAKTDDLQIQTGNIGSGSGATNAPEAVGAARSEPDRAGEGRVGGPGSDQGTVLRAEPGTLTRVEEVVQTGNPAQFIGQRANFMNARVQQMIGDRVLLLGVSDTNGFLPVRLKQPVPGIQPGQQIRVSGVLAQMPQYLRWWDLNEQQEKQILKSPIYLNAMDVHVEGAPRRASGQSGQPGVGSQNQPSATGKPQAPASSPSQPGSPSQSTPRPVKPQAPR